MTAHEAMTTVRKWREQADKQPGWSYRRTGTSGWVFLAPDNKTQIVVAETHNYQGLANVRARLRRAGLKIK